MMKQIYIVWLLIGLILLVSSCSSNKSLRKSGLIEGISESEYLETVMKHSGGWQSLTAKMSLIISLDEKRETKVNGTLKMKKGEVIQFSIAPFLGIEVARAEISSNGVLVIDRMNKRYVRVSFSELKSLTKTNLNFQVFQALFFNELFLPGKDIITADEASLFTFEKSTDGVWLDFKRNKGFYYRFLTQGPEGLLRRSVVGMTDTPYQLNWNYDDFHSLEQKFFPSNMVASFEGGENLITVAFKFSRLSTNADWETYTEVSSKYEKVELEDLIKMLLKE